MNTIEETRLLRLKMLRDELGSVSEIAKVTGITYAQVSQWVNESPDSKTGKVRNISSESARLIEKKTGKDRGWFDQPVDMEITDKEVEALIKMVKQMPKENRPHAKRLLDVANELASGGKKEQAKR